MVLKPGVFADESIVRVSENWQEPSIGFCALKDEKTITRTAARNALKSETCIFIDGFMLTLSFLNIRSDKQIRYPVHGQSWIKGLRPISSQGHLTFDMHM